MEKPFDWQFSEEELLNDTPSRRAGMNFEKEMDYRRQAAHLSQDLGVRLGLDQVCINTAIHFLHRFYMIHSLTDYHRNSIAAACIYLAAKVEYQERESKRVIQEINNLLHKATGQTATLPLERQLEDLMDNEITLMETLDWYFVIEHPDRHIVNYCAALKIDKNITKSAYFLANNTLHLTTMCLRYRPTTLACFCINFITKWAGMEIPLSKDGKEWFLYFDKQVTAELLTNLTIEYLEIFEKCPPKLQKSIRAALLCPSTSNQDTKPKEARPQANYKPKPSLVSRKEEPKILPIQKKEERKPALPPPRAKAEIIQERFASMMLKKAYQ